jgi:hypothetical protein
MGIRPNSLRATLMARRAVGNATERGGIEPFMTTSTALTTNSTPEERRRRGGNRGPVAFKQRDVARAVRAVKAAGFANARIVFPRDGGFAIETADTKPANDGSDGSEWD